MNAGLSLGSFALASAAAWLLAMSLTTAATQSGAPDARVVRGGVEQPTPAANQPPMQPAAGRPPEGGGAQNMTPGAPGQRAGGNATVAAPAGPPAPRAAAAAAASSIAQYPDLYYGQFVSVYATVEKQLTPLAFTLDQDKSKSTGKEVIVVTSRLHETPAPNSYVTVIGEVVKADAGVIAKRLKGNAPGLPADVLAQHTGKPVIVATSVIAPSLIDIARFIAPPMTPEEESLDKAMKSVGPANGALRKGIDASNVDIVKTNAAILSKAFAETEAFWKKRGKDDAVKMATTARTAVDGIEKGVAMGNWNDVKTHNTTLGQQCASCHGTFRERLEDGSFAVKKDIK